MTSVQFKNPHKPRPASATRLYKCISDTLRGRIKPALHAGLLGEQGLPRFLIRDKLLNKNEANVLFMWSQKANTNDTLTVLHLLNIIHFPNSLEQI